MRAARGGRGGGGGGGAWETTAWRCGGGRDQRHVKEERERERESVEIGEKKDERERERERLVKDCLLRRVTCEPKKLRPLVELSF